MIRKLLMFLLMMAIFNICREILVFVRAYLNTTTINLPVHRTILLIVSLSYIFTIIFTGFSF